MARRITIYYLVAVMFIIGIAPRVEAAFMPSQAITLSSGERAADVQKIQTVLEMKLVKQRLLDLGFSPEEIQSRVSEMSDQQIHSFAQKLDDLKVGQDGLGIVIAILVIVLLVILIINLTSGKKVVVTQ
ncbi:MAG TPA: hypothetical protein DDZ40_01750 [Deltaproteobacteria bacterium]|nr:hypothetical protein [Deltaproteobacteria bacterium]